MSGFGGSGPFNGLTYQPPEIAVYADGSVVLGADTWFHLAPADLAALRSGLQKDLVGQPAVIASSDGQGVPEKDDTVLGVRRTDGSYQTVRTTAHPSGPPLAAYTALEAVKTSAAAKSGTPYAANAVRLIYTCTSTMKLSPKFWPDGLPTPTSQCPEMLTASGDGATVARDACLDYDSALHKDAAAQEVPYLAEGNEGIRTCVWRWALPDEESPHQP